MKTLQIFLIVMGLGSHSHVLTCKDLFAGSIPIKALLMSNYTVFKVKYQNLLIEKKNTLYSSCLKDLTTENTDKFLISPRKLILWGYPLDNICFLWRNKRKIINISYWKTRTVFVKHYVPNYIYACPYKTTKFKSSITLIKLIHFFSSKLIRWSLSVCVEVLRPSQPNHVECGQFT